VTAQASSPAAPANPTAKRKGLGWLIILAAVVAAVVGVSVSMGARLTPPTVGLAVAAVALVFFLQRLYSVVRALSSQELETSLSQSTTMASASARELREEKQRLLRALNELQFDHEMGKLSAEDYKAVRQTYEMRAIEVLRALDAGPDLHPDLMAELRKRQGSTPSEHPVEPEEADPVATDADETAAERICSACGATNDPDAKFCKACGGKLET
jgi:ribosomal protein L40E